MSMMIMLINKRRVQATQPGNGGESDVITSSILYPNKNVRITPDSAANAAEYQAFGFDIVTGGDRITSFFRIGISEGVVHPYGSNNPPALSYAHLYRGRTYKQHYYPSTDTFSVKEEIYSVPGRDLADTYGIKMDNGEYIYFGSVSPSAIAYLDDAVNTRPPENAVPFYRKASNSDLVYAPPVYLFTDPGASGVPLELKSCSPFGKPCKGANPGEYYIGFYQFDYEGTAARGYCIKTTNYFNTWSFNLIWNQAGYSENMVFYMGGGKLVDVARRDNSGNIFLYVSIDSGVTWTPKGPTQNLWWSGAFPQIIHGFVENNLLTLMCQNRDTGFVYISHANAWSNINDTQIFNRPEIFFYTFNGEINGNPSLGYPCVTPIGNGKYFVSLCTEVNGNDANRYYTITDLQTDNGLPAAPPVITTAFHTATSFRLFIDNYTDAQLQNIRGFEIDLSTQANFSTYVMARIEVVQNGGQLQVFQDVWMWSRWITPNSLITATTYYYRIRACNNNGKSGFTNGSTATL